MLVQGPSPLQERTPQHQQSSRASEYSQSSGWSMDVVVRVMMFRFMYEDLACCYHSWMSLCIIMLDFIRCIFFAISVFLGLLLLVSL